MVRTFFKQNYDKFVEKVFKSQDKIQQEGLDCAFKLAKNTKNILKPNSKISKSGECDDSSLRTLISKNSSSNRSDVTVGVKLCDFDITYKENLIATDAASENNLLKYEDTLSRGHMLVRSTTDFSLLQNVTHQGPITHSNNNNNNSSSSSNNSSSSSNNNNNNSSSNNNNNNSSSNNNNNSSSNNNNNNNHSSSSNSRKVQSEPPNGSHKLNSTIAKLYQHYVFPENLDNIEPTSDIENTHSNRHEFLTPSPKNHTDNEKNKLEKQNFVAIAKYLKRDGSGANIQPQSFANGANSFGLIEKTTTSEKYKYPKFIDDKCSLDQKTSMTFCTPTLGLEKKKPLMYSEQRKKSFSTRAKPRRNSQYSWFAKLKEPFLEKSSEDRTVLSITERSAEDKHNSFKSITNGSQGVHAHSFEKSVLSSKNTQEGAKKSHYQGNKRSSVDMRELLSDKYLDVNMTNLHHRHSDHAIDGIKQRQNRLPSSMSTKSAEAIKNKYEEMQLNMNENKGLVSMKKYWKQHLGLLNDVFQFYLTVIRSIGSTWDIKIVNEIYMTILTVIDSLLSIGGMDPKQVKRESLYNEILGPTQWSYFWKTLGDELEHISLKVLTSILLSSKRKKIGVNSFVQRRLCCWLHRPKVADLWFKLYTQASLKRLRHDYGGAPCVGIDKITINRFNIVVSDDTNGSLTHELVDLVTGIKYDPGIIGNNTYLDLVKMIAKLIETMCSIGTNQDQVLYFRDNNIAVSPPPLSYIMSYNITPVFKILFENISPSYESHIAKMAANKALVSLLCTRDIAESQKGSMNNILLLALELGFRNDYLMLSLINDAPKLLSLNPNCRAYYSEFVQAIRLILPKKAEEIKIYNDLEKISASALNSLTSIISFPKYFFYMGSSNAASIFKNEQNLDTDNIDTSGINRKVPRYTMRSQEVIKKFGKVVKINQNILTGHTEFSKVVYQILLTILSTLCDEKNLKNIVLALRLLEIYLFEYLFMYSGLAKAVVVFLLEQISLVQNNPEAESQYIIVLTQIGQQLYSMDCDPEELSDCVEAVFLQFSNCDRLIYKHLNFHREHQRFVLLSFCLIQWYCISQKIATLRNKYFKSIYEMVVRLTAFTSHNNLAYTESTESVSSYKLTDTDNEFNKVTRKDSLDRRLVIIFNNIASYMKSLVSEACGGKICQKMKYSDEPLGSHKDIVDDFSSSIEKYSHPYPGSVEYYSNGEVIVKQLRLKPLESKNSYLNGSPIHATLRNKYKKRIGIVSSERIDINNILERGRLGSEKDKNSDKINVPRKQDEPSTQKSASDIEFELIVNISDQTNVNNSIENEEPADRFTKVKAEEQSSGGKVFDKKEEYGNECDSDLVSTAIKSSLGSQVSCMSSASLSSAFFKKRMFNKLVYTQDAEKPKTVNPFVQFLTFRRLKKSKELYRYLKIVDFIDSIFMMRLNLVCMDSEFDSYSRNIETITQSRKMPDDLADLMSRMGISVKSDTYAKFGGLKTHRGIYYRDPYKGVLLQFSPNLVVEKYQSNRNPQQTQEEVEVKRESAKANSDADDNENITQTEGSSDIIEHGCNLASENGKKNNYDTDTDTLNSQSDISSSENDDGFTSDSGNSVASEKTSFTNTNVESKDEMVESEEMVTYKFLECLLKDGICVVYTKRGINEISMQYFWDKIYSEFDRLSEKIKSKRANVSVDAEDKMDTSCENSNIIEKRINEAQKKKSLVKETDPEKDSDIYSAEAKKPTITEEYNQRYLLERFNKEINADGGDIFDLIDPLPFSQRDNNDNKDQYEDGDIAGIRKKSENKIAIIISPVFATDCNLYQVRLVASAKDPRIRDSLLFNTGPLASGMIVHKHQLPSLLLNTIVTGKKNLLAINGQILYTHIIKTWLLRDISRRCSQVSKYTKALKAMLLGSGFL